MPELLVVQEGTLKGKEFELEGRENWILGRDPDLAQIILEDPSVSREHLRISKSGLNYQIENLSETSATLVNGREVQEPIIIENGDLITLGEQTLRFENRSLQDSFQDEPYELKPAEEGMNPQNNASGDTTGQEQNDVEMPSNNIQGNAATVSEEGHDSIFGEEKDLPNKGLAHINFDLLDSGRFLLKVIGGPNNGAEFSMNSSHTYLIGTDPSSCDIVFHDTSVSRQHARVYINDEKNIAIEDLKSRNGTLVDGKTIEARTSLSANSVVTVGTSSFVIYDREGNMQTIISPLLPQIVKSLQKDEEEKPASAPLDVLPVKKEKPLGAFILIAIITGLFVLVAMGVNTLFKSEPVESVANAEIDTDLQTAMAPFPDIKYSFNKSTGRLLLVGHVLTATDKNQLLYNLQGLNFIKSMDDSSVVIDELVWQNTNEVINRTPGWKGISIQSPKAGQYILTGYLQNRKQAEQLYDYISANFPYLDKLERQIVVEEDVVIQVTNLLNQQDIRSVNVQFANGDVILSGGVPALKQDIYLEIQDQIKKIPGVRQVRSQVTNLVKDASTINVSDRYEVSGYSQQGSKISIMINGRIVAKGDTIDGMLIKSISPNTVLLEKDGVSYRIDYNK